MNVRNFVSVFIIVIYSINLFSQSNIEKHKVGLVLGGGGAKGFAHIGVLKVLKKEGIPIDLIVGTSIGSIVAAFTSVGYTPDEIDSISKVQNWETLFSDGSPRQYLSENKRKKKNRYLLSLPILEEDSNNKLMVPAGAVKGQNVLNLFNTLFINIPKNINFNELPIPYTSVATSLITGNEVDINEGNLPYAVLSSMAIPGVFHPVIYEEDLLVDGGVLNNFPSDVAKKMGADIIIGVDLKKNLTKKEVNSLGDLVVQLMAVSDVRKNESNQKLCDIYINPDLSGYSSSSFSRDNIDSLILRGEVAAKAVVPELKALISKYNLHPNIISRKYVEEKEYLVTKIEIPKELNNIEAFVNNRMDLELDKKYSNLEISDAINRLYAYGNFSKITYNLEPNDSGYTLILGIYYNNSSTIRAGFEINTVAAAAVHLNYSYESYTSFINLISIDTKVSVSPKSEITLETHHPKFPTVGLKASHFFNKIKVFDRQTEVGKSHILGLNASLYATKKFWRSFNTALSVNYEYLHSELFLRYSPNLNIEEGKINNQVINSKMYLNYDNLDDYYIPSKGHEATASISLGFPNYDFSDLMTTVYFHYRSLININRYIDIINSIYYRSISAKKSLPSGYLTYASNSYNAISSTYIPLLGQSGIGVLKDASSLSEMKLRFRINKYYISPTFQILTQQSIWNKFEGIEFDFGYGVSLSTKTSLGPIDICIGGNSLNSTWNMSAGLGFRF